MGSLVTQVRASRTFLPCQSFQLSKLCRFKESGLVAEDTVLTTSEADSHGDFKTWKDQPSWQVMEISQSEDHSSTWPCRKKGVAFLW